MNDHLEATGVVTSKYNVTMCMYVVPNMYLSIINLIKKLKRS